MSNEMDRVASEGETSRNISPERGIEMEIRQTSRGEEDQEPQLSQPTEESAVTLVRKRNTLQEIASDPALRLRLKLWQNEDALLRMRIQQKEESVTKTKNEIYQLFGIFAVFEGVVLTALAQASQLNCHHWWIPFVLTTFAGVAVTFAVWYKFRRCEEFQNEVDIEKENAKAIQESKDVFLEIGTDYDPHDLRYHPAARRVKKKREIKWMISVTTAIVAFTAVIAVACPLILCSKKPTSSS